MRSSRRAVRQRIASAELLVQRKCSSECLRTEFFNCGSRQLYPLHNIPYSYNYSMKKMYRIQNTEKFGLFLFYRLLLVLSKCRCEMWVLLNSVLFKIPFFDQYMVFCPTIGLSISICIIAMAMGRTHLTTRETSECILLLSVQPEGARSRTARSR